ncbi:hypothetical protein BC332_25421 [Capsicum chinense]|nr:hypothetical protein BC332_25421 [Capsicum chinense]
MYKIEKFLCKLKRYVRNKAQPEGSIAEGYIIDECLTFCSMYFDDIETRFNHKDINDDGSSPDMCGTKRIGCIVNDVRYHIQQRDELCKSQNCGIAVRGLHEKVEIKFYGIITDILELEHIYDVLEKENLEVENDELLFTNVEVYQDTSLESKSIVNDIVDMLSQLYRDDVELITIGANVIELEAQTEYKVEVDYDEEDSDQEDDTMVEYISDHEKNEGTLYLSSELSASPIPSSPRPKQTKSTTKKLIFVSNRAPKDFGLEKKKVNSIRASNDPRIDRSTNKWKEGVLLYRPPGRGDTLLARVIASNIDTNFLKVVSSTIIDKYICESARLIWEMFNYACDHQMQLVDAVSAREPMQTVKSKECSWSCSIIWMEILKIHATGIYKHGEIDYEAAIKLDEVCIFTEERLERLTKQVGDLDFDSLMIDDKEEDLEENSPSRSLEETTQYILNTRGDVLPKDGSDNKARMVDSDIDVANKESVLGRQVHEAFDNSTNDYKQLVEKGVPNVVLPLLIYHHCGYSCQGSRSEDRHFRSDFDEIEGEEASFSGQDDSSQHSDIVEWAKANNHGSLQILCEYYQLKCPVRGSTTKFHPMDHLHPLEYYRPDEAFLYITGSTIDLKSCRSSLELAEAHNALIVEEEATALSVWAVACFCGSLWLEHVRDNTNHLYNLI